MTNQNDDSPPEGKCSRAEVSGIRLTSDDAATIKGMLVRGDRSHGIASLYGVNPGRIAEISTGDRFAGVQSADLATLPPKGPYLPLKDSAAALRALAEARRALDVAERLIKREAA